MKNKIILGTLILFCAISIQTSAQSSPKGYAPQDNFDIPFANKWKVLIDGSDVYGYPYWNEFDYFVVKDTIIGEYTYQLLNNKKCIRYSDDGMQFYYLGDSAEYLLCDYSLEVGDTCYAYMGDLMHDNMEQILLKSGYKLIQPWIVKSKEVIDQRIHIIMACNYNYGITYEYETEMIQGIGSKHFIFPFMTSLYFDGGAPSYTLCAFKNNENIYSFDLTKQGIVNNCPEWSLVGEDIVSTFTQTTVTKICKDGQIYIHKNGKIFDLIGQEITQ